MRDEYRVRAVGLHHVCIIETFAWLTPAALQVILLTKTKLRSLSGSDANDATQKRENKYYRVINLDAYPICMHINM